MTEDIVTGSFPELLKRDDHKVGVLGEYANVQAARVNFAQVMRANGYKAGSNHTWIKPGFAVVMGP